MADSASHVRVSPAVMNFPPPLNRVVPAVLQLENISNEYVAYKVKTTAPKRYVVRPNLGIIPPAEQVDIQVMLHMSKDPPDTAAAKDRFQVQTILLKDSDKTEAGHGPAQYTLAELRDLWQNFSRPEEISKMKLKCTFLDDGSYSGAHTPTASRTPAAEYQTPSGDKRLSGVRDSDASNSVAALQQLKMENKHLKIAEQKLQTRIVSLNREIQQLQLNGPGSAPAASPGIFNLRVLLVAIVCFLLGYFL